MNLTLPRNTRKSLILVLAYPAAFAMVYALLIIWQRKAVVKQAVSFSRAYWDEEERQNKIRLFGRDDI